MEHSTMKERTTFGETYECIFNGYELIGRVLVSTLAFVYP